MIKIIERIEIKTIMFPLTDFTIDLLSNKYYLVSANDKPLGIVDTLEKARRLII
jgi:hypothetical protein